MLLIGAVLLAFAWVQVQILAAYLYVLLSALWRYG